MNLDDLKALVATAETGSLAKAALRLNITQPAVTRRIQRLEADLGTSLLDRDLKPARLTRAGADTYRNALRILQAAQDLRAEATGAEMRGPLRIGISYAVADSALGLAVEAVQRAMPDIRLVLSTDKSGILAKRVAARDLDAAVVCALHGRNPDGPFSVRDLGCERVLVVAPASHPGPSHTSLAAIARERWVLNPDGCGFRAQLDRALVAEGREVDLAVEAWGAELQLSLIARGAGFGLIPAGILAASPRRDYVRILDVADFRPEIGVVLLAGPNPGAVKEPIEALGDAIAREIRSERATAA